MTQEDDADTPPPPPRYRVVIPIVAGIGNALLAVPMVRQLKRAWPESRVTILARIEPMGEVFRRLAELRAPGDEVLVTGTGAKGLARMVQWSRQRRPDVYLVPFPSNRWQYSLLAATSGAKDRLLHNYPVGYVRALRFLPATRVPARRGIHDVEQNLRLLEMLRIQPDLSDRPTFALTDADRARAAEMLRAAGVRDGERPIVIHAGSARTILSQAKRWPPANYARLVTALRREFGDRVLLVEGPDEAGVSEEIIAHLKNMPAEAGKPAEPPGVLRLSGPLGDAAAVLARAAFYVGSDSGLAHLAAAVGTNPVTLFAPADPDRVCPAGHRDLVVQAPVSCAPCFKYPYQTPYPAMGCREPFCIHSIGLDKVLAAVRRAVDKPLAASPGTPGEGGGEGDVVGQTFLSTTGGPSGGDSSSSEAGRTAGQECPSSKNHPHPHPNPLPEYREREQEPTGA